MICYAEPINDVVLMVIGYGYCVVRIELVIFVSISLAILDKPVSWSKSAWYHETCSSVGFEYWLQSSFEKSLIERVVKCLTDRTEGFDYYYPWMNE